MRVANPIDDAEHAAGLQRSEHRPECELGGVRRPVAFLEPVVHVAERHDEIGRAGRRDRQLVREEVERRGRDGTVQIRVCAHLRRERVHLALLVRERRFRAVLRDVELAALAQHGRKHLRVPTAARPDLDDGHLRSEAEELERLLWMAIAVARFVRVAAMRARECRIDRGGGALLRLCFEIHTHGRDRSNDKCGERQQRSMNRVHGRPPKIQAARPIECASRS